MLKRLVKDTAIYGSGDFIFKLIAFAVFPIYAHVFSVAEFGIMSLVTTVAEFIGTFLNMGMNNAVQRFYWDPNLSESRRPLLVSTGFWVLLIWSIFLTALVLFIIYPFAEAIRYRYEILWIFILLSLLSNIPAQILQYSQDVLRLHFSPWKFTLISAWKNFFGVLLGLLLILGLKQRLEGFFWGNFGALIVSIPLGFWFIRKDLRLQFDASIAKEIIHFGYPFVFAGLAYWIFGALDRWMLSELSNNTEVGLYSIAFKFATILLFVNAAFGQAWSPFAIKIYSNDPQYRYVFSRIFSYWFFGLTFIGVLLSLFSFEMLYLTTPGAYWPAATILVVLAMGMVMSGTTQITAVGISLERKTHLFAISAWLTAIINIVLNLLMIPIWGALGAAIATLISNAILTSYYLYWTQRLHPIPLEVKKLLFSLILILLTIGFSFYINKIEWGIKIVIFKLLFCGLIIFLGYSYEIVNLSDIRKLTKRRIACEDV